MIERIETGLTSWAQVLESMSGRNITGNFPGMGAAGGISAGLVTLLNASIVAGADYILELTGMDEHIRWADRIITGEGRLDLQSMNDKAPVALARKASSLGKPVIAICGTFQPDATDYFCEIIPICTPPMTVRESTERAEELVIAASRQLATRLIDNSPVVGKLHHDLTAAEKLIHNHQQEEAELLLAAMDRESLPEYWYLKGMMEQQLHNWGNAINHYRRCLDLDPGHKKAASGIEIIQNILSYRNPDQFNP